MVGETGVEMLFFGIFGLSLSTESSEPTGVVNSESLSEKNQNFCGFQDQLAFFLSYREKTAKTRFFRFSFQCSRRQLLEVIS